MKSTLKYSLIAAIVFTLSISLFAMTGGKTNATASIKETNSDSIKISDSVLVAKDTASVQDSVKLSFLETGGASWYGLGDGYHGKKTASGEIFNTYDFTAAHKKLKFGTWVRVTNLANNKYVDVKINDRGPFVKGRVIDLSYAAKNAIDMGGTAKVKLELIEKN